MIRFTHYVTVYDEYDNQIPVFPSMLNNKQLKELEEFCKRHDYRVFSEQAIDMCFLPYED